MKVSITLATEIDFGDLGRIETNTHIIRQNFWGAIKQVGWKRLWRIRRIKRCRPLKQKWTIDALQDIEVLHGVNLEQELLKAMEEEMKRATSSTDRIQSYEL